ncbi:MAG: glucose-6-phosphate isomerase [Vicinamibacterales bacterium]
MHHAAFRSGFRLSAGALANAIESHRGRAMRAAIGLWNKDASTWSTDPAVQGKIANRLGWLASPALMADAVGRITEFAGGIRRDGFTDVVLLGMGGSSLAPEVLRAVIGSRPGWPQLHVLDSTDPTAVRAVSTTAARTLYVLASKSGSTIEPNALAAHFAQTLRDAGVENWGAHFVAITDPGTALAARASEEGFREAFINPPDIGGRFSALSYFGLVPAALMGQDVEGIVRWGLAMLEDAQLPGDALANPALGLGLLMGAGATAGRDKLTLVLPPALEPFGLWVEQLVAESTGKDGVGVVPIVGEPLGPAEVYGHDRVFARLRSNDEDDETLRDMAMDQLIDMPVVTMDFPEGAALGAEFVRWEIATAVAGAVLGVNPFDEPNVQQAKDATRVLLDRHAAEGGFPAAEPDRTTKAAVEITSTTAARTRLPKAGPEALLRAVDPGDYVGLLVYLAATPALARVAAQFRLRARDRTKAATTFGLGPRYLHSTGQLHKGGANNGVFVLVTADAPQDVDVPGEQYSFATLELAQALGDFASLEATGRRAVHIHLPSTDLSLLEAVLDDLVEQIAHA